ncbi:MAG: hypothetical protein AAGG79_02865 [Pseudomonadota bacterium]
MSLVPQLGMPELLVLAMLVLLVVGPKDLPKFLHGAGKVIGKGRRLADEFRAGIQDMARQVELDEMRKEIEELKQQAGATEMAEAFSDLEKAGADPSPSGDAVSKHSTSQPAQTSDTEDESDLPEPVLAKGDADRG